MKDKLKYKRSSPDLHVIFGYLQVGAMYNEPTSKFGIDIHPHAMFNEKNDCIYEAADCLSFNNSESGFGTFDYRDCLVLTKKGKSRSRWHLPNFFRDVDISYHTQNSFKDDYFDSAKIGQEFVLEANDKIADWVKKIIENE